MRSPPVVNGHGDHPGYGHGNPQRRPWAVGSSRERSSVLSALRASAHRCWMLFAQALIRVGVASARMAELKARLQADLTVAMKAQDRLRTATLRLLLTAIRNEELSGKQARELSDDEVLKVLAKESKKRGEAAEIYTQHGRGDLAANEHAEARVIDEYLPTPLTEAEVADVADTAIAQVAEEIGERPTMKQMGQVMKAATAIAAGKADGARLSAAVKDRL
jgi:uncharacterized protein